MRMSSYGNKRDILKVTKHVYIMINNIFHIDRKGFIYAIPFVNDVKRWQHLYCR